MQSIKNHTDISQSEKLAEILPRDSADMHYGNFSPKGLGYENKFSAGLTSYIKELKVYEELKESYNLKNYKGIVAWRVIPCWSLATLLDVLPEIQGGKPVISLDDNYISYPHMSDLHTKADNLIDACYEMILKLHELNLL